VPAIFFYGTAANVSGQVLVDSYLGGSLNSYAPFAGLTGVTPTWQNLGGIFTPDVTSQLTEFDVSIFASDGTPGAARLTIFQYDQPVGFASYLSIGPSLGYAEVPVGNYSGLVTFDFSDQNIQLTAGQTYAYMLSNPLSTTLDPAWYLRAYTSSGLEINSESQFVPGGFNYASVVVGASPNYEVFANPVPEPSTLTLASLGALASFVKFRRKQTLDACRLTIRPSQCRLTQ
jgi:hypothetical protein